MSYGGAISSFGQCIQMNFEECSFDNNSAYSIKNSYGGAIYAQNDLEISKCKFNNNTAYSQSSSSYCGVIFSQFSYYYFVSASSSSTERALLFIFEWFIP